MTLNAIFRMAVA